VTAEINVTVDTLTLWILILCHVINYVYVPLIIPVFSGLNLLVVSCTVYVFTIVFYNCVLFCRVFTFLLVCVLNLASCSDHSSM